MRGYWNYVKRIWPVLAVAFSVDFLALLIGHAFHLKIGMMPLVLLMGSLFVGPLFLPIPEMFDPNKLTPEPELSVRLAVFAANAGVDPLPVFTVQSRHKKPNGFVKDNRVFLTSELRETFSDDQIDFVLAHEVSHLVRTNRWKKPVKFSKSRFVLIGVFAYVTLLCAKFSFEATWWTISFVGFFVLTILLMKPFSKDGLFHMNANQPSPELELWCDRNAVELTGNPVAAIEALERLVGDEKPFDSKLGGYPRATERLAQIRALLPT